MDVFVARQPILKKNDDVYGYEILYRNSLKNQFVPMDGNQATSEVLRNTFLTIGLERMSQNKPCFINFTEQLLLQRVPEYFSPEQLVVEILEDVSPTQEIIAVCRELKQKGYQIALDDVDQMESSDYIAFMPYIDIIKMDIKAVSDCERTEIIQAAKRLGIILLAEKVETREDYEQCKRDGFDLFQGFYFSKPYIVTGTELPFFHSTYFLMIQELSVSDHQIDIERVTEIIGQDLSLTYKLLRLINTTVRPGTIPIESIRQAVMLLGTESLKKWLYVLSIDQAGVNQDKAPSLIMKTSLTRAKMSEQIAVRLQSPGKADGYFLAGFMSLIDVVMKRPMKEIVNSLPLDTGIQDALNEKRNLYREILDVVIAMEQADFDYLENELSRLDIQLNEVFEIYGQSIAWTDQLYEDHFSA
ncbi:EAL domain-containing protein [Halobacillus litoralis]|uniref:EAL and HDOD domain-containing protein n=1 Tax=Halobacillus litoralis TaxID=45668 RepID=UPI001CD48B7D|nr:EAL domain-containing protein [Halobacillus litoralis]MCA0971148.1 EAL domain-containing protein [Halobacillus litoralis]